VDVSLPYKNCAENGKERCIELAKVCNSADKGKDAGNAQISLLQMKTQNGGEGDSNRYAYGFASDYGIYGGIQSLSWYSS
jgi:hypothetical protein